jgi:hypothetical protein
MDMERNLLVRLCPVLTLYRIRNSLHMTPMPTPNMADLLFRMHTLTATPPMIMILMVTLPLSAVLVGFDDRKQNVPWRDFEKRDIGSGQVCWARNEEANRNPGGDISCMYVHFDIDVFVDYTEG